MTDYELRNASYDELIRRKLTKQIVTIMQTSEKEMFTKSNVYNIGKKKYGFMFPTDPTTIFRYLNTMSRSDIGILKKIETGKGLPNRWKLIRSPYVYEELIVDADIEKLKELSEELFLTQKADTVDIVADETITIYGFPSHNFHYYEKEFNKITTKIKKNLDELSEIASRSWTCYFFEKIDNFLKKPMPLLDKQLGIIFAFDIFRSEFKFWKWLSIDSNERNQLVIPDIDLLNIFKKNFYPHKSKEEIFSMLKNYRVYKTFFKELKFLESFAEMLAFKYFSSLTAVVHGGLNGRETHEGSWVSSRMELMDKELIERFDKSINKHQEGFIAEGFRTEKKADDYYTKILRESDETKREKYPYKNLEIWIKEFQTHEF